MVRNKLRRIIGAHMELRMKKIIATLGSDVQKTFERRNTMIHLFLCFAAVVLICGNAVNIYSQGADPEKSRTKPRSSTSKPRSPSKSVPPKQQLRTKSVPRTTRSTKTLYGSLTLQVDQPESEIFLSGGNIVEGGSYFTEADGSPFVVDELEVASYKLIVRKNGYYDESRQVYITGGKTNSQIIKLRPSTAFLSVTTNTTDAEIEVENIGTFRGEIDRVSVSPGTYRIHVRKQGFISGAKTVTIGSLGETQSVAFEMKPFPIDSIIAEASTKLAVGDYQRARELCDQVLAAVPANAKANLIRGTADYYSQSGGEDDLLTALRSGETVKLQVRLQNKDGGKLQLLAGELILEKHYILFKSSSHPTLNFSLFKPDLSDVGTYTSNNMSYLGLKGRGEFNGKRAEKKIEIYSHSAAVSANRKELLCTRCTNSDCSCAKDAAALYKLVSNWKTNLR